MVRSCVTGLMLALVMTSTLPARAAFHFWEIREVYTDASGTNQFIEFFSSPGSQQFVGGQVIRVTSTTGTNTFTIPSHLPGDSAGKSFIVGTLSITNFGAPKPDYIIPNNFVFPGGGNLTFFIGSGPYTALPTDGSLSRTWVGGGNAVNSPRNFAGQTGTISIPVVNTPPVISITSPFNNANFGAGDSVPVTVSASDPGGSVVNVRLLTNGVAAATNTVAPFGFTLPNLPPGDYTLRAIAQDNGSLTATSAPVTIHMLGGPRLVFAPGTNGPIRFTFQSSNGYNYVIERALPLTNFTPVVTNPGNGGTLQYAETNGVPSQGTYRVRVQ
jgi:hypothetical protein